MDEIRANLDNEAPGPRTQAAVARVSPPLPALRFENDTVEIAISDIRYELKQIFKDHQAVEQKLREVAKATGEKLGPPRQRQPDDYNVAVTVKIRNKDSRRILTYRGQQTASGAAIQPGTIEMRDDVSNEISNITYWTLSKSPGNSFEQLEPSTTTSDTQLFKLPPSATKSLKLTIPADAVTFNHESVIGKAIVFEVTPNQIRRAE